MLVVDDAPVLRALVARGVKALGHAVVGEAASLDQAQALAAAALPDVIAVDGRLATPAAIAGAADVATLVRTLQAAAPAAAIFVIASLAETRLVKSAVAAGARGAIKRPILASQLRDVFASLS